MPTLILSTSAYRFSDDNTGEIREGVTLSIADEPVVTSRSRGLLVSKVSAPLDALKSLERVPGYYDIDYRILPGTAGKAKIEFKSAKFLRPLVLDFGK